MSNICWNLQGREGKYPVHLCLNLPWVPAREGATSIRALQAQAFALAL